MTFYNSDAEGHIEQFEKGLCGWGCYGQFCDKQWTTKIYDNFALCDEHAAERCRACGKQATHGCGVELQFVCGEPLCDEHTHQDAIDAHNGKQATQNATKPVASTVMAHFPTAADAVRAHEKVREAAKAEEAAQLEADRRVVLSNLANMMRSGKLFTKVHIGTPGVKENSAEVIAKELTELGYEAYIVSYDNNRTNWLEIKVSDELVRRAE